MIRWRAESDKKGQEWRVPMPPALRDELKAFRLKMGGAFGGLMFPSLGDPKGPVTRDSFGHWLADAEAAAVSHHLTIFCRTPEGNRASAPNFPIILAAFWRQKRSHKRPLSLIPTM
jgi:hypothetical protein